MSNQVTDPAWEMAALIDWVRAIDVTGVVPAGQNPTSWQVLSRGLELSSDSAEFLEVLAAARTRLGRFNDFLVRLVDPTITPDVISLVRGAIGRFAQTFNAAHLNHPWASVVDGWALSGDATTFRVFSPTMRQLRPLRQLLSAEREDALNQIDAALAELEQANDIEELQREALAEGYRKLRLTLAHFEFFGHPRQPRRACVPLPPFRRPAVGVSRPSPSARTYATPPWREAITWADIVHVDRERPSAPTSGPAV